RLVVTIGNFTRVGTRRIHEGDDGNRAAGVVSNDFDSAQMMLGHPHAAIALALLRENAHSAAKSIAEIETDFGCIERPHLKVIEHLSRPTADAPAGANTVRAFRRIDRRPYVAVDVEFLKVANAPFNRFGTQYTTERSFLRSCKIRKPGIVCRL